MSYKLIYLDSKLEVVTVPDEQGLWSGHFIAKLKDVEGDDFKRLQETSNHQRQECILIVDGVEYASAFALARRTTVFSNSLLPTNHIPYSLTGKITDARFKPF